MHKKWGDFISAIAIQGKLVNTSQLGFDGVIISSDLSVTSGILVSEQQNIGGNMIIKSIDIEDAVNIAKRCPILLMGGNVEVRDISPM